MFNDLFTDYSDKTIYFIMGSVGTLLFMIKAILMLAFGHGDSAEFSVDMHADGGMEAHGTGFSLISMLSILSFMMGAGWMGLMCRTQWNLGPFTSAMFAALFGFGLMLMSSGGMYAMKRLQQFGGYDVKQCMNQIGRVYLTIPAKGEGAGQIEINFDGRNKILPAISAGGRIESFASVKVIEVRADNVLIVEPV